METFKTMQNFQVGGGKVPFKTKTAQVLHLKLVPTDKRRTSLHHPTVLENSITVFNLFPLYSTNSRSHPELLLFFCFFPFFPEPLIYY